MLNEEVACPTNSRSDKHNTAQTSTAEPHPAPKTAQHSSPLSLAHPGQPSSSLSPARQAARIASRVLQVSTLEGCLSYCSRCDHCSHVSVAFGAARWSCAWFSSCDTSAMPPVFPQSAAAVSPAIIDSTRAFLASDQMVIIPAVGGAHPAQGLHTGQGGGSLPKLLLAPVLLPHLQYHPQTPPTLNLHASTGDHLCTQAPHSHTVYSRMHQNALCR